MMPLGKLIETGSGSCLPGWSLKMASRGLDTVPNQSHPLREGWSVASFRGTAKGCPVSAVGPGNGASPSGFSLFPRAP